MYHRDDDRGLLLVEQLLGRRLERGETEEEALAELRAKLREDMEWLLTDTDE